MRLSDQSIRRPIEEFASLLIKYAVLISVACTAISFAVNWSLFLGWGLSYSVVASPSDALVGAFEALGIFLPHLCLWFLGYWLGRKLGRRFPAIRPLAGMAAGFVGIFLAFVAPSGISLKTQTIDWFSLTGSIYLDYLLLSPLIVLLLAAATIDHIPVSVYLAGGATLLLVIVMSLVHAYQNRAGNLVVYGNPERCRHAEYVVWSGSTQVVTTCKGAPFTAKNGYFIIPKDGLIFRSIPKVNSR